MDTAQFYHSPHGRRLAYRLTPAHASSAPRPGVVFLGGFKSDMQGTKALHLQHWASREGLSFLRFDYSGHGESSEDFTDGAIGDWAQDARDLIEALTEGPQVLVGSSMGGWIALLLARWIPNRVAGMVTIAAAPDFTEDSMWAEFSDAQRATLQEQGQVALTSDYDDPYIITQRLIEDGRDHLVLRTPLALPFPVRSLQGTNDTDVDVSVALRLLDHVQGDDIRLSLVKGADHRFSTPDCLDLIENALEDVLLRSKL